MPELQPPNHRSRRKAGVLVATIILGLLAAALPAFGHASFPGAAGFGFEPNPTGGTGLEGSTPPYAADTVVTIWTRVPFEQEVPFEGSDDTTVDVNIVVPAPWSDPACGEARTNKNDESTNFTNQPGTLVAEWDCEIVSAVGHDVVNFSGPQVEAPETAADSAQFFSFTVRTPKPDVQTTYDGTLGTEGFIVDQLYASGHGVHWIPNEAFVGTIPTGFESVVAGGLRRTVAKFVVCGVGAPGPFDDVSGTHPFCEDIDWMAAEGIASGFPDGNFRPASPVTRQAMAAFLYRYDGEPAVGLTEPFFADVPESHPFYDAIQWMAESGLSTGTPNPPGKPLYKPAENVARQAMAAFLYRYAHPPVPAPVRDGGHHFADIDDDHPFFAEIQWMGESGLSTGTPNPPGLPLYKPTTNVSREAMSAFIHRFDLLP